MDTNITQIVVTIDHHTGQGFFTGSLLKPGEQHVLSEKEVIGCLKMLLRDIDESVHADGRA